MATTKAAAAAAPATGGSTSLHRSGAISKGYNFASTWEQNAPLTEQQQAAIVALSHAFAERPFPVKLVKLLPMSKEHVCGRNNGLSISTKHRTVEELGAIEAVLVNINQFYKWFTDLEAAMKSETEEKYQHYLTSLTEHIQTCDGILHQVDETLDLFNELQMQHQAVATKTKTLHDACDQLLWTSLIEKQRLIEFAESLRSKLNYFDELENDHLRRILRGQASLFDWSRSTSLARTLSPRVLESQIDSNKELDKNLEVTCEEFIMSVMKLVVDPLLSFVTKVTAVKVALSSGSPNQKLESVMAKPLKDQAFSTPDKVIAALQQEFPRVMEKMKLYLMNPSTRTILFKPLKTNIVEAHIRVQYLLKSEYSPEDVEGIINMDSIQDLQVQLDNLL